MPKKIFTTKHQYINNKTNKKMGIYNNTFIYKKKTILNTKKNTWKKIYLQQITDIFTIIINNKNNNSFRRLQ
jgi:hypothetical protein